MQPVTIKHEDYIITTDKRLLKPEQIHAWLSTEAYWSKNIPFILVKQAFEHSFCIGILYNEEQVGYARLVTDYASFGYLADVYVVEEHRGKGLSKKMLSTIMELDWVKNLRRIMLATLDAHELYKQLGFVNTAFPERFMEINRPAIYESTANTLS